MTHQTHQSDQLLHQNPDALIGRALQYLRDTQAPTGLEGRIAARLAQAADHSRAIPSRTSSSLFAPTASRIPFATVAATALLALALFAVHNRRHPTTVAHSNAPAHETTATSATVQRTAGPPYISVGSSPTFAPMTTRGPEARPIRQIPTDTKSTSAAEPTDPDTLALAETLAPSHPAPRMPMTAQEHLLLLASRQGQPMELAELETLRQPVIQAAAEAHQNSTIRRYAQSLLGPLAAAEALNPTSSSPPSDETPTSQPPTSR